MPTDEPPRHARQLCARAGLLYLTVVATGVFALMYVPSVLFVTNDAAATTRRIAEHLPLFQLSIVAGMLCYVAFLLLPLTLYKLLGHVHRDAAVLMVIFAIISVPISLINLGNKFDIVSVLTTVGSQPGALTAGVHAQVMRSLGSYRSGVLIAEIFWGLWLFPFGYLVVRSGTLPRVLGVCLMLGCIGYLINVVSTVLVEGYASSATASVLSIPSAIGEIGICLWLLWVGFRPKNVDGN